MTYLRLGACACLLLLLSPVLAQTPDEPLPAYLDQKLDQPVTTTLRREATLKEGTKPAYVVTRAELQAQGAQTVDEALKYLPGIRTEGATGGQLGAQSSQIMRGGSTAQVLILLDGRPLNDQGFFGGFDLSQFSTEAIERIEVVPGGASTLYGADAVGGVINLVTPRPLNKDEFTVGADLGSFGLNAQTLRVAGSRGPVGWSVGYQRLRSDNNFPYTLQTPTAFTNQDQRRNADVLLNNGDGKLRWQLDERNRLDLSVLWLNKDLGVPGGVPITSDSFGTPNFNSFGGFNSLTTQNRQVTSSVLSQLTLVSDLGEGEDSRLTARLYGDFLNYQFRTLTPDSSFPTDSRDEVNRTSFGGQLQHSWQITPGQLLTYGGDYRTVQARNTSTDFLAGGLTSLNYDAGYSQGAFFVQDEIQWDEAFITVLGVRQDFNSNTDGQTNPSLGARWQITPTTSLRGNYSQSFRAPTLFDSAYVIDSPFFQLRPNPGLRPERAESYDVGLDQQLGRIGLLRFTFFTNTIADLNQFVSTTDPFTFNTVGEVINLGLVRAEGIETSLDIEVVPNLILGVNYTAVGTQILQDQNAAIVGNQLAFRPDVFNINLNYQHQGWGAGVFVRSVSSFFTGNRNQETLPGYTTLDLKFQYPVLAGLDFNLSVNNVLDQQFEEAPGFPGLGLEVRTGLRWRF
ncbi:TonB-dependent siderophore receptor [Candidatus Cyanaurora vandensis]|uniref:TonB-dependent receptor plug domain-containing protein n=1 Tax=Candidatus Cyanaurora vandensis TaxID=2714958 RepID=UPI00257FD652|nr:TonB-dependent receptor [Candidatus Cyanaurora vandensis]